VAQAHLHTQWPGAGKPGNSSFDAFMASRLPVVSDFTLQQVLNRDAIIALLTKIGPAILLTHSQAGAFGWPVADARPDLVKAIVAVEPSGPPFFDVQDIGAPEWFRYGTTLARPWGITSDLSFILHQQKVRLIYKSCNRRGPILQSSANAGFRKAQPDNFPISKGFQFWS
jgi:pimeloyl-ACP methyl ester carboxylesterase